MWGRTMGGVVRPGPHVESGGVWHSLSIGAPSKRVSQASGVTGPWRGLGPLGVRGGSFCASIMVHHEDH